MPRHGSGQRAVIIGGGISGTLTARELARDGWHVTLVEAAHVGAGSSSRTAAGIRQQFTTPATVRGMRYSVQFYKDFASEVEEGTSPLVPSGYLFLVGDGGGLGGARQRVAMQRQAGLSDVELLEGADLFERFPWVSDEVAVAGTWCPSDGFLLPSIIYQEAARAAKALGATILQNTRVTGARIEEGRIAALQTTRGELQADLFIDCTNAWSPRLARNIGAAELPIEPLKRYLWFLQREGKMSANELSAMPLTITPGGIYCRPENAETLMMGKAHTTPADPGFSYDDQDTVEPRFSHNTGIDAVPFELWMELAECIPAIGEFGGITATTAGYYAVTPDHNPFMGFDPKLSNLMRLVGFSGHGAMFGPFTALVARHLAEAGRDLDTVTIDGAQVEIGAFAIGRPMGHAEALVI